MKKLFSIVAIMATLYTNFAWATTTWPCYSSSGTMSCQSDDGAGGPYFDGQTWAKYYISSPSTIYINSQITNSGTTWANVEGGGTFGHYYNFWNGVDTKTDYIDPTMSVGELTIFADTYFEGTSALITVTW